MPVVVVRLLLALILVALSSFLLLTSVTATQALQASALLIFSTALLLLSVYLFLKDYTLS